MTIVTSTRKRCMNPLSVYQRIVNIRTPKWLQCQDREHRDIKKIGWKVDGNRVTDSRGILGNLCPNFDQPHLENVEKGRCNNRCRKFIPMRYGIHEATSWKCWQRGALLRTQEVYPNALWHSWCKPIIFSGALQMQYCHIYRNDCRPLRSFKFVSKARTKVYNCNSVDEGAPLTPDNNPFQLSKG